MYKVILFDLGGVLFTDGTASFMDTLSKRYEIPKEKIREVLDGEIGKDYREARITRDEFWKKVISSLGLKEDANTLEAEWIGSYSIIEKTKEIIQKLRKNYKVYFLSGNVKEREQQLEEKYKYKQLFDGGIFSYEVGVNKPDPRIYKIALERVQAIGEEVVFIDDKESAIPPAKDLGITAILFKSPEQLEKELTDLGIF